MYQIVPETFVVEALKHCAVNYSTFSVTVRETWPCHSTGSAHLYKLLPDEPTFSTMIDQYSSSVLWIVVVGFVVGFILAFGVGANSVPNCFATSVGAKVLTLKQACCLGTVFEMAGALLLGE
jgi:hypothetical protein